MPHLYGAKDKFYTNGRLSILIVPGTVFGLQYMKRTAFKLFSVVNIDLIHVVFILSYSV